MAGARNLGIRFGTLAFQNTLPWPNQKSQKPLNNWLVYLMSMQDSPKETFWKRQFSGEPTRAQTRFDVIMGIVLPVFCVLADPIVFCGYDSIMTSYRWLAYSFIGVEILILGAWLTLRRRAKASAVFFVGPFLGGSLFALAIGLGILPISLLGALVLIGLLGFTPFCTAIVFARNGVRALAQSRIYQVSRPSRIAIALAGIFFIGTPPLMLLKFKHHLTLPAFAAEAGSGLNNHSRVGRWIWTPHATGRD